METVVLKGKLTGGLTDQEFLHFCLDNRDLRIERNSNLEIVIMSPVSTLSAFYSSEIFQQLALWNKQFSKGIVFDSSVGFTLPDRSILSPDASWLSREKWNSLSREDLDKFAPVCPDFVIEVLSKSDSLSELQKKMKVWISNGCESAWLINPRDQQVFIYKEDLSVIQVNGFETIISGTGVMQGFELDLSILLKV